MRAFCHSWSLPVTWQRWRSHRSIRCSQKPRAALKFLWFYVFLCFIQPDLLLIEVLHCQNSFYGLLCSCDLDFDLNPMTFMYKLDRYSFEIYRKYKHKLRQGFRKLSSDRQVDRQSDRQTYCGDVCVDVMLMPWNNCEIKWVKKQWLKYIYINSTAESLAVSCIKKYQNP